MTVLHVVFSVADAEYAIPASLVVQLESYRGATRVPGAAGHVAGIVQIRGQVVPVVDLRRLFGYEPAEPTIDTRVIVAEQGTRRVGLLVDKSREVLRLDPAAVQATPALVAEGARGLFGGVVQLGSRLLMLVDLRKVVGEEESDVEFADRRELGFTPAGGLPGGAGEMVAGDDRDADQGH